MTSDRVPLPVADGRSVARLMRRRIRPHAGSVIAGGALLAAGTAVSLVVPRVLGELVDRVNDGDAASTLTTPILVMLAAVVCAAALTLVADFVIAQIGETLVAELREEVVERALALPLERVEEAGSGDLVSRVGSDVSVVADAVQRVLPGLLFSGLTVVLTMVGLAALDWRFALGALAAVPLQVGTLRWYIRRCMPLYAAERTAEAELGHEMLGSIRGAATIRSFRLGSSHVERTTERSLEANDLAYAGTLLRTRLYGRLNVAEAIGLGAILTIGFLLVRADAATIGAATAAALYFHRIFDPVNAVVGLFDDLLLANAGLARLLGVIDMERPSAPAQPEVPVDASIDVAGLSFEYQPGHTVLSSVTLRVGNGEHVAIVGASGAGKSTIAKLMAGIYVPTTGTIRIGGAAVSEIEPATLRRTVALITQEVHVFSGTVGDDLRLARPDASDADVKEALDAVGAGWVDSLPDGMATIVGGGGHQVTSMQAQQLALARLLLADPAMVVLDEATADAGSAGARVIERAAAAALRGRTAVIVGHRLTQAATADRIIVMDAGRVVEQGTHDELVAAGGSYAALWAAWQGSRPRQASAPEVSSAER